MNTKPKERSEYIGMKVTPREKEQIYSQAAALGLTVTAYLVGLALGSIAGFQLKNPSRDS